MKKKIFAILIICCVLIPVFVFSVYQVGYGFGYSEATKKMAGLEIGADSYRLGYQAGLRANTTPTPSP
jgi:hypothetical protein